MQLDLLALISNCPYDFHWQKNYDFARDLHLKFVCCLDFFGSGIESLK
jgi:hypothetical protein